MFELILGTRRVPLDEVLEHQFGVGEVRGLVVVGLSVDSFEGFLEVLLEIDILLEVVALEHVFVLLEEILGSLCYELVEEIDLELVLRVIEVNLGNHRSGGNWVKVL